MVWYLFQMIKSQNHGFSLIELLIALGIWILIFSLSVPLLVKDLNQIKAKGFFDTLQSDVLYAQSLAMRSKDNVRLILSPTRYVIVENQAVLLARDYPEQWTFDTSFTMNNINFDAHGRILNPGSIQIKTPQRNYRMVFPFGTGRGYVVE